MPTFLSSIISGRARNARVVTWICILGFLVTVAYYRKTYLTFHTPIKTAPPLPTNPSIMAAAATLQYLTVPAISKHTATVVFVHGLGDTGHGWKPVADMFKTDPALAHVKWILPHSPKQAVKANLGMVMPSWFDIYSFGFDTEEDEMGMLKSARLINQLISAEVDAGMDPRRIVLGGFSQGGTMSLLTGLTGERKLAGVAVLSGWLPLRNKFKAMASQHAASIPVFWGHGAADPLVKFQFCKDSADFLTQTLGMPLAPTTGECKGLSYNIYEGIGHTTTQRELDDLREWIKKAIPSEEAH